MVVVGSGADGSCGHRRARARPPTGCCTPRRAGRGRDAGLPAPRRRPGDPGHLRVPRRRGVAGRAPGRAADLRAEIGASLRVATFGVRGRTMYPPEVLGEDEILDAYVEQTAGRAGRGGGRAGRTRSRTPSRPWSPPGAAGRRRSRRCPGRRATCSSSGSSSAEPDVAAVPRLQRDQDRAPLAGAGDRRPLTVGRRGIPLIPLRRTGRQAECPSCPNVPSAPVRRCPASARGPGSTPPTRVRWSPCASCAGSTPCSRPCPA